MGSELNPAMVNREFLAVLSCGAADSVNKGILIQAFGLIKSLKWLEIAGSCVYIQIMFAKVNSVPFPIHTPQDPHVHLSNNCV